VQRAELCTGSPGVRRLTRRIARAQKSMGVASRVADYAQKPALHEGRGMMAGRDTNVTAGQSVPCIFAQAA
jgi:hypothetical protein